ncbi:MAG: V-type ATP synthase subunit A [Candidatus Margulisbacteria bacterium]|nr:V-type ATP synthase subunit A [Candidatus Margulisiibacteriota bacterium]MBU1021410.1 V-type ATP synthase subunit A [Candidatus Margulisiibacteriota bacterium]MBU1728331.1 V-type ATP synthase subunit A [Candidatus Margulisiibacteriota bacterium]MBU1955926.1 V-type ATP synthase subunit A [Candidatus Margulisiibacteriota bacterium]
MLNKGKGKITKVSGPLIIAENIPGARMADVVRVGEQKLIGEIIEIRGKDASIQVYEETSGLGPEDPVETTGLPLSVELAPGLLGTIFDGIQRPLAAIEKESGAFIGRGIEVPALDRKKKWEFKATAQKGNKVKTGDILGTVQETSLIVHKIMVPEEVEGEITDIKSGNFTIEETVAEIQGAQQLHKINMIQKSPVRKRRPLKSKIAVSEPLITGQRIIDTLFTIGIGGTACIPGPFGSGKTVVQHQLAKWANVDIVVFVGCGERGNEMTDVLLEFPKLKDPKSGKPLMERTIMIANTSNMPIAAREASVYTGATIAEYYRDMGYNVALMADSTSRWAEALREMSGRLEEMPGEEGYPAYLGTRLAEFYERSGIGLCQASEERKGSLSIIGSVSPPGGDLSEPVVQNTLRVVKVFWGLDYKLAHKRHFPAINWLLSYSLYLNNIKKYLKEKVSPEFEGLRIETMQLLQRESELEEIVRLVGLESLSEHDQLIMLTTKSIREDFLYQSAFDPVDQYSTLSKQYLLLKTILFFHSLAKKALSEGKELSSIEKIRSRQLIAKARFIPEDEVEARIKELEEQIKSEFKSL